MATPKAKTGDFSGSAHRAGSAHRVTNAGREPVGAERSRDASVLDIARLLEEPAPPSSHGACVVCGTKDARVLVMVELRSGEAATLCGSHAVMHARANGPCATVEELRALLTDRRSLERRATGEGDELAERLSSAFLRDRRATARRSEPTGTGGHATGTGRP